MIISSKEKIAKILKNTDIDLEDYINLNRQIQDEDTRKLQQRIAKKKTDLTCKT